MDFRKPYTCLIRHIRHFIFYISGTNKSAALQAVMNLIENIDGDHIFECGTLEGLMKSMEGNKETTLGCYDEFATFIDSLDKGKNITILFHTYIYIIRLL